MLLLPEGGELWGKFIASLSEYVLQHMLLHLQRPFILLLHFKMFSIPIHLLFNFSHPLILSLMSQFQVVVHWFDWLVLFMYLLFLSLVVFYFFSLFLLPLSFVSLYPLLDGLYLMLCERHEYLHLGLLTELIIIINFYFCILQGTLCDNLNLFESLLDITK